jgi:hypothetical protein
MMARIPTYEEQAQFKPVSFEAPVPRTPALQFDRLRQAIGNWQERSQRQMEARATAQQQEEAAMAQRETGPGRVAQPPEYLAPRFQEAFRRTARDIERKQMAVQTQRVLGELSLQHRDDPQGFRKAVEEYADKQEKMLEGTAPALAVETGNWIRQQAEGAALRLEENQYSREQARQSAKHLSLTDEYIFEADNELRTNPDELRLYEHLDTAEGMIDQMVDDYLLDPATAERKKSQYRETMAYSYAQGAFDEALRRQDPDGAQEIIESLHRGAWFENNEKGRAMADRLARQLSSVFETSGVNEAERRALAMQRLTRMEQAARDGLPVDMDAAQSLAEEIITYGGTEAQVETASLKLNGMEFAKQIHPQIRSAPVGALAEYKGAIDDQALNLETETRRALSAVVNKEIERVDQALRTRDYALIGGESFDIYSTSREEYYARREHAARRLGVPPNRIPLFTQEERARFSEDYNRAAETGDYDAMNQLTSRFLAPLADNQYVLASEIRKLGEAGGPMWVAAQLASAGEILNIRDMQHLYSVGITLDHSQLATEAGISRMDIEDNDGIMQAIRAISSDDPALRGDVYDFVYNVYVGRVDHNVRVRGMGSNDARQDALREISRQLQPFTKVVEFDNDRILPYELVPTYVMREKVNEMLDNPRRYFGIPEGIDTQYIHPVPLDEGGVGFYHDSMGRFLTDADTNEIARVPYMEGVPWEPSTIDPEWEPSEVVQETLSGMGPEKTVLRKAADIAQQTVRDARDGRRATSVVNRLTDGAAIYGMDPKFMRSLTYAVRKSPDEFRGGGRLDADLLAVRPSLGGEVRWDKVISSYRQKSYLSPPGFISVTPDISNPEIRPYAVVDVFDQYKKRFKGDEKAMLAAYWEGPDVVESLQRDFGDGWYDQLPLETRQFIKRAENARR